ncbi:MAG: hypothetical protein ABWY08_13795, partial [Comamonas sp.]
MTTRPAFPARLALGAVALALLAGCNATMNPPPPVDILPTAPLSAPTPIASLPATPTGGLFHAARYR